jgi:hypothetical protein
MKNLITKEIAKLRAIENPPFFIEEQCDQFEDFIQDEKWMTDAGANLKTKKSQMEWLKGGIASAYSDEVSHMGACVNAANDILGTDNRP